jgi:hypothetical protein
MAMAAFFQPNLMWSAVDRNGIFWFIIVTGDACPSSRAIAIAKPEAAYDFSNHNLALQQFRQGIRGEATKRASSPTGP